jgi:hypothetical protein
MKGGKQNWSLLKYCSSDDVHFVPTVLFVSCQITEITPEFVRSGLRDWKITMEKNWGDI